MNDAPITIRPSVLLSLTHEFADSLADGLIPEDELDALCDEFVTNVISEVAP